MINKTMEIFNKKPNMTNPFLSVCITSYNRTKELKRCLESINSKKYTDKIEIIISEDHSPQRNIIKNIVSSFALTSKYHVIFNSNKINIGYDNNLGKLIELANGQYILFLSDDDALMNNAIDTIIDCLKIEKPPLLFSPFFSYYSNNYKRKYKNSFKISASEKNAAKYLHDSILFSGLIFDSNLIKEYDSTRFKNFNYYQVYLFLNIIFKYGGYYLDFPTIHCFGDGENAYGIAESSEKNEFLANRKSIYSDIEFHKGLFKTIDIFDKENHTDIKKEFSKEYSLRSYRGLRNAKKSGKKEFNQYWEKLKHLDIKLSWIAKSYFIMLSILGWKVSDWIIEIPKKVLIYYREHRK